jgi:hypothetical protein
VKPIFAGRHHGTLHEPEKHNRTLAARSAPVCDSPSMTNVIRPTFGRAATEAPETVDDFTPLQVYGTAVGHFVALIRAEDDEAGQTLQLIVGQADGGAAEAVAILPDTAEGEADAEITAYAILRTLEIVKEAFVDGAGSSAPVR